MTHTSQACAAVSWFPQIGAGGQQVAPYARWSRAYGAMIESLRGFPDKVAAAKPDVASLDCLSKDLQSWSQELAGSAVEEREQVFAPRRELPDLGQTMVPRFVVIDENDQSMHGVATFGRYFLGSGGAAQGGAIPLLLDDVIGRLANSDGRPIGRTASLRTDDRSVTPIGTELALRAWFVGEEGRKRTLWCGDQARRQALRRSRVPARYPSAGPTISRLSQVAPDVSAGRRERSGAPGWRCVRGRLAMPRA